MANERTGGWADTPERRRELQDALDRYVFYGSFEEAARSCGMPVSTFKSRVYKARHLGFQSGGEQSLEPSQEPEDIPDYDAVRARVQSYNPGHIDGFYKEKTWRRKIAKRPFGMAFIGDLHLDSPGFDVRWWERDKAALNEIGSMDADLVSVFMGDILDNWPMGGRLAKKHHDSHLTRLEALALVKGFLQIEYPMLDLFCLGNHDDWPGADFKALVREWSDCTVVDWGAHVVIEAGDFIFRAFVSHDMRGSSVYNPIHGLARRAREDGGADLYVAAHRHTGGQARGQNGFRDRMYNMIRVRGYKRADEYAWGRGFPDETEGASGLAVVNPFASSQDGICRLFYDLEEGREWLAWLLKKHC